MPQVAKPAIAPVAKVVACTGLPEPQVTIYAKQHANLLGAVEAKGFFSHIDTNATPFYQKYTL